MEISIMTSRLTLTLGGLLLVATTLVSCGGSNGMARLASPTPTPTPTPTPGGVTVIITITGMNGDKSYSPNPSALNVGQTVAFHNADSIVHTATADNGAFDTGDIAPGATSAPITMTANGTYAYHSKTHSDMVGTLGVPGWDY
jgi:plastocyanin